MITNLSKAFSLKDVGVLNYFLGIEVVPMNTGLFMNQGKYIRKLLSKPKMQYARSCSTPMTSGTKLSGHRGDQVLDAQLYRSIVGGLQYLTVTRPEISFSVNKVCQFMHSPLQSHRVVVKRILRYLAVTVDYGLELTHSPHYNFTGISDADWRSEPDDRKSNS